MRGRASPGSSHRHPKSEDNKPDVLTLFSVEKHVEEGGSWSMGADEPAGFVLWMGKGLSVDGAIEIVKTGALVV